MDCLKELQLSPAVKLKAFRHLQANPEAKDELLFMYGADGEAGVLAVLEPVQATNTITVQSNSKADIYIGCSITHGNGKAFAATRDGTSNKSVSKEWKVRNDGKAYLSDKWFSIFDRVKKSGTKVCLAVPDGATPISLTNAPAKRLFGNTGLQNVAFVDNKNHDGFSSIETSKISFGQGPSGFLHLQPEVLQLAKVEGLIAAETPAPSSSTQQQPAAPPPPPPNDGDLMSQLASVDIQI